MSELDPTCCLSHHDSLQGCSRVEPTQPYLTLYLGILQV